jgi:hypothetical protein
MRTFLTYFLLLHSFYQVLAQDPQLEIKFSEPLAVFVYVEQLSSKQPDNGFKKQFTASVYNREKYQDLLALFDTLNLSYTYDFEGFPFGSKNPGMTEALLKKNLVSSNNLKDFKQLSVGILPNSTLLQLTAILYEFQFVYRELVYQPGKQVFEKQLAEIKEMVKNKKLSVYFDKALFFYKAYWDESLPFEVAFYPLPGSQGFHAEAFCNSAASGLPQTMRDYSTILGVVMHEIFHILYNEQAPHIKKNIAKWFLANPSKTSNYAFLLMNEVIATAMGNGYVYGSLVGKQDEGDWYDRKYINQMAKKIHPMLAEYLNQKKGMDEGFINVYIKFYEDNFSDWLNEMDNLMCYRYVLSDRVSDFSDFSKLYPYASLSQYEDQVSEASLERLKTTPLTKVIIISEAHDKKLEWVKRTFPELKNWKYKAKQDFLYHHFLKDKTQLIIVNTVKQSTELMIGGRVVLPPLLPAKN